MLANITTQNGTNTPPPPDASATPQTTPHLLKLDRRLLAHMGAVKEITILLATVSFVIEERWFGVAILLIRGLLSYYERVSVVSNPIQEKP